MTKSLLKIPSQVEISHSQLGILLLELGNQSRKSKLEACTSLLKEIMAN